MTKKRDRVDPMRRLRDNAHDLYLGSKEVVEKSQQIEADLQGVTSDLERITGVLEEVGPEAQSAVIRLAQIHSGLGLTAENAARMSEDFRMLSETLTTIAARAIEANTDMGNAVIKLKTVEEEPRALVESMNKIIDEQGKLIEYLRGQSEQQVDQAQMMINLRTIGSMDPLFIGEILTNAMKQPSEVAVDALDERALVDWVQTLSRKETLQRLPKEAQQALLDSALDAFSTPDQEPQP